jgi:serine/threonine-protein kinase
LGRGGMGTVYAGVHCTTGQRAAIKLLAEAFAEDERFRERFMAEVETLKKLRHENIVTLLGYGEEEGRLFFVMELVDGPTLEAELRAGRRFTWREAAGIGVQVCAALKHAHDSGVIHRDLKPGNLMLDRDGKVKLADFGIAKLFGTTGLTLAGSMIGTPDFMSPEQTEGRPVTPRSDLYSLGCVLYALLAGGPPFQGATVTQVVDRVRFEKPRPLRAMVSEVPEAFDDLVLLLLRKDPEERVATPQLLGNLLQAMQHAIRDGAAPGTESGGDDEAEPHSIHGASTVPDRAGSRRAVSSTATTSERVTADFPQPGSVAGDHVAANRPGHGLDSATVIPDKRPGPETPGEPAVGPEGQRSHFTTVTEEDWRRSVQAPHAGAARQRGEWLAITVMALALLAIAGAFVFALLPVSANRLYERIVAESQADHPSDRYEEWLNQFLQRFPDDARVAEVQLLLAEHRCRYLREALTRKVRHLTELERCFVRGMDLWDEGRREAAQEMFVRIIGTDEERWADKRERRLVDAAKHMLSKF